MEKLKKLIIDHRFDLVGLAEVNKDWRKVSHENTIWSATSGWTEHRRVQVSQNTTKPCNKSELLIGGTAMIAFGDLVFRISHQNSDPRNLGRWSSITISGKNTVTTRIFTCYCPVRSSSLGSAYAQQLVYMAEHKNTIPETSCPRQLFGIDLKTEIDASIEQGHNVIVMGDFNSDYSKLKSWMLEAGLEDILASKHGPAPKTHLRSKDAPIDCIFATAHFGIRKGGFLSFHKLLSDHRGIWVDIPKFMLYGYNPPQPIFPSARRLKLNDPRVVQKYLTFLYHEMDKHDLFHRMDSIHKRAKLAFPSHLKKEYEAIDQLVCKLMDAAERQCRRLHTGAIAWSPTYKKACLELLYWLHRRTYILKCHQNVRQLIVMQHKLHIEYDPNLTLSDINNNIIHAHKKRKRCKKLAESLSLEYRTQLAIAKEEAGETKAASYIRNLNHIEAQRRLFRNIRFMEGKTKGGCTSKLITSSNGIETEHTEKVDIEQLCADANEKKYHQTETGSSQLLSEEFISDLGLYGEGSKTNEVLNGTYTPPPSADNNTIDFLNNCKRNQQATDMSTNYCIISRYQNHVKAWKVRKEKTCTHHQHIGHFKAVLRQKDLRWFFFQRSDILEITGYSPTRHRECVDLMIMKKSMCYDVQKQRTIGILDTEFNQNNKKMGKTGMDNAISLGKVAAEQFAVKHKAAIEQIVSKRCVIDHHHSKRRCFSLTSNDLAGCYDRIIHTAAALALLRVGIPHNTINSMFSSIQRMVHRIRTMYGDSDITYGGNDIGNWRNFPQGVLQGNACGPTIWVLISSIIFEILHKRGFAMEICSSISKQVFCLVGFAYVDDSDLIQSGTDPLQVLQSMQDLINSWGSLMAVTGGAICTEKSWWYMVDYTWKKGKWVACDAAEDFDLVAKNAEGHQTSLKRLLASEASEMLGVWVAPNGCKERMIHNQRDAAIAWGVKVSSGHPSKLEAWQALYSNITAKLKYPLPACSLSETECKSILYPAIKAALPKAGIASNLVCAVRDAPLEYGGAGVLSLYHQQGSARIALVVDQLFKKTPTGKILLTCIEDLVLDSGLYGSLWKMPFDTISKYVQTHSLIFSMIEYNHKHSILINSAHGTVTPQRTGDSSLMSLASKYYSDSPTLRSIQRVRMAFGAIHLSDICSVDGNKLDIRYLQSQPSFIYKNKFDWPSKHHYNRLDLSKWRNLLRAIFNGPNKTLPTPLGPWKHMTHTEWFESWDFFLSPDQQFLFHQINPTTWKRHLRKETSRRSYHTAFLLIREAPSTNLLRASVKLTNHTISVTATSSRMQHDLIMENDILSFGHLQIKKPSMNWFLQSLSASPSTDQLITHLLQGTAVGVSDGSFFPRQKVGSCAWTISTPDGSEYIKGGGIIPGSPNDQSSYRSELGGQVGIANILANIILPPSLRPHITVACDGLSALQNVHINKMHVKCNKKDSDLISIICSLWNQSNFCPITQHVYGHQDSTNRHLTSLEKLNCQMDSDAKDIACSIISKASPHPNFEPSDLGFGSIICGSKLITSNIQASIYKQVTHQNMLKWINNNGEIKGNLDLENINWHCFSSARKEVSLGQKLFLTKWISGDTATGRVMCLRKKQLTSYCPRCHQTDEHLVHVLICPSQESVALRHTLLQQLVDWLKSNQTHPRIVLFLKLGLSTWFTDQTYQWHGNSHLFSDCPKINSALQTQLNIGWYHLLCGFITNDLIDLQQCFFTDIGSLKSSTRWGINLTKQLWNIVHQMWLQRNDALHKEDSIQNMTRLIILKSSISQEHNQGLQDLPHIYSSYFHIPLPSLLKRSQNYLKRWFLIIRSAREAHGNTTITDAFTCNGPMRKWIKLQQIA